MRCVHEAQMHSESCFLTLTYRELPAGGSLSVRDLQLFWKRLRKDRGPGAAPIRYLACGEYGEETARPHYHACLFGEAFLRDRKVWKQTAAGPLFTSEYASSKWSHGFVVLGDVTFESAAYVAKYTVEKVLGKAAPSVYGPLRPPFSVSSRRPGIGSTWWDKYGHVARRDDSVVAQGREQGLPRAYDRYWERDDEVGFKRARGRRVEKALELAARGDSSPERLAVRERVTLAKVGEAQRVFDALE